jgi:outer membrane biosynthesis protein TonB
MHLKKDSDRKGLVGTILVHSLLILLLIISSFSPDNELELEEGGVEVSLGEPDYGGPDNSPAETAENTPQPESSPETYEDPVLSQDEEAPEVQASPKPNPNSRPSESKPVEESKPAERKPDQRSMFPGNRNSRGQGKGEKPGNEGRPDGSMDGKPDGSGTGTTGNGNYSLAGRAPVSTAKPNPSKSVKGNVVVYITVDSRGKVIKAQAGARGTTIADKYFWRISEQAALEWKFDSRKNGSDDQFGTITFEYSQN